MARRKYSAPKDPDEKEPVGDEEPAAWPEMQKFAIAYADRESETRGSKVRAMQSVFPDMPYSTAVRKAYRWLEREDVQDAIRRVDQLRIASGKMGAEEYAERCITTAEDLFRRGTPGDASAAAQLMKLAGTTLGFLIRKTEDLTPPERKRPLLPAGEVADALLERLHRVKRLQQPVPLTEIAVVEAVEVKPKRPTPWPEEPSKEDRAAALMAKPRRCIDCGSEDALECGDGRYRCAAHVKAWAQSQIPRPDAAEDHRRPESPA